MDNESFDDVDKLYESLMLEPKMVLSFPPLSYERGGFWQSYRGGPASRNWPQPLRKKADIVYYNNDRQKHRKYGPAHISHIYDFEAWYINGELHRIGGPARRHKDSRWWFVEGKLHRLDGPAVDMKGHPREYWINGQKLSPKEYKKEIERRKRKGLIIETVHNKEK